MTEKRPIYPKHPGQVLAEELAEIGMTPAELARKLHVPSNRLYQVISGRRAMTADTALRVEQWLGVEAAFWMNPQKGYGLDPDLPCGPNTVMVAAASPRRWPNR